MEAMKGSMKKSERSGQRRGLQRIRPRRSIFPYSIFRAAPLLPSFSDWISSRTPLPHAFSNIYILNLFSQLGAGGQLADKGNGSL